MPAGQALSLCPGLDPVCVVTFCMLCFGLGACHLLPSRAGLYLWDQGKVPEPGTPAEGRLHRELNSLLVCFCPLL